MGPGRLIISCRTGAEVEELSSVPTSSLPGAWLPALLARLSGSAEPCPLSLLQRDISPHCSATRFLCLELSGNRDTRQKENSEDGGCLGF